MSTNLNLKIKDIDLWSLNPRSMYLLLGISFLLFVSNNMFGQVGGDLTTSDGSTELTICALDGVSDAFDVTLTNNQGDNSAWVITDDIGTILALPPAPPFDLDGAGAGLCQVWHLSYNDGLTGLDMGANTSNLQGTFDFSNPINVDRRTTAGLDGGTLAGGPFTFTVGDGVADNLVAGSITLTGNTGTNSQWVVTDANGYILGLPPMPSVVDFDGAGPGTCLVWHLSFEDGLSGAEVGMNAADLQGCFSLSNSVTIQRDAADGCQTNGGELFGGPFTFTTVGDGVADNIPAGSITLANATGTNSQWVVTDNNGVILGLPPMPSAVNFDGAGAGTCLVWHLSFEDGLTGAEVGMNAADLDGCYSLSNSITVERIASSGCQTNGGELFGGPFIFDSVGDGVADMIPAGSITSANTNGDLQWVVTDSQGYICLLYTSPSPRDATLSRMPSSA